MRHAMILAAVLMVPGCNSREPDVVTGNEAASGRTANVAKAAWDLQSSDEGASLVLGGGAVRLFCPSDGNELLVNVQAFRPIGSEERMSFGQGGEVVALVAGAAGDAGRGGVTGRGEVPANLPALLSGDVSVAYGAQVSGPHPQPAAGLVEAFARACSDGGSAEGAEPDQPGQPETPPIKTASACLIQDGRRIGANTIRAVGTEPFWAATVEGRCVTYSHPDNQAGTRVWTKFSGTAEDGTWIGSLEGKPFELRTQPQAGCSDGMSDKRYPIAVSMTVGGEQRSGCAEPR